MTEQKNLERDILVIPAEKTLFLNSSFTPTTKEFVLNLEKKKSLYKKRQKIEEDENFKQLIPYIAFIKNNKILTYKRTTKGGENRLFNKYSIGVGGHIDSPDNLIQSSIREVKEEIDLDIKEEDLNFVGFINFSETPVDRVHLGIAIIVKIDKDIDLNRGELDKLTNRSFENIKTLSEKEDKLENWSKIFFHEYLKNI